MTETVWLGWHFFKCNGRTGEGNRVVVPGKSMRVRGDLVMCYHGLHACKRAIDALCYAPGPMVQRVELRGERVDYNDKSVARERYCIWSADATQALREFTCWCAEEALPREREAGREPDPRSWKAVEVARQYLQGNATKEELAAAQGPAMSAWLAAQGPARAAWSSSSVSASLVSASLVWPADAASASKNARLEELLTRRVT